MHGHGKNLEIQVGTLLLEIPLRNQAHGRAVADDIARELQGMPPLPVPSAAMSLERLSIDLPPLPENESSESIAKLVVASIHRALSREIESANRSDHPSSSPVSPIGHDAEAASAIGQGEPRAGDESEMRVRTADADRSLAGPAVTANPSDE